MEGGKFFALLQHRHIHGGVPNTAPTLYDQCVESILRYIRGSGLLNLRSLRKKILFFSYKFCKLKNESGYINKTRLTSTAAKLLERILATMLVSCEELPIQILPQILSRETAHLDTRKFEDIELTDLLCMLQANGVEKLQSFLTSPFNRNPRICVHQLVQYERLTVLYMRQLHCCNDQLALLAIKFPLLT